MSKVVDMKLFSIKRSHHGKPYTMIVGDDGQTSLLLAMIDRHAENFTSQQKASFLRAASVDRARLISQNFALDRVIASDSVALQTGDIIDNRGKTVPIHNISFALDEVLGRVSLKRFQELNKTTHLEKEYRTYAILKRSVDVTLGLIVLVLLSLPTLLLLAIAKVWTRSNTMIKQHKVVGKNGKVFTYRMIRFDDSQGTLPGVHWINAGLHRSHLELLPALWSVVKGEMSLVGPRPETPALHAEGLRIAEAYALRLKVRPGIISLPQVRFSYSYTPRDMRLALEYDLYYLGHRSALLDFRIFCRAVLILINDWGKAATATVRITYRGMGARARNAVRLPQPRPSVLASVPSPVDEEGNPLAHQPSLIIGAGAGGRLLSRELQSHPENQLWPVAFVDDDPALIGSRINGIPVLGNTSSISAIAERERIAIALIAIPSAGEIELKRITMAAQNAGLPVLTMPSIGSILAGEDATKLRNVPTSDLLGRPVVQTDVSRARSFIGGKRVIVTGAAGSIGYEVVKQALRAEPETIYGIDTNESGLYDIQQELAALQSSTTFIPIVASVTDQSRINQIMTDIRPHAVFHAAAYKHVPLMEDFPHEAIETNIHGTQIVARAAARVNAERFVLVSTDKAVRPTSVMGASKRIAELIVHNIAHTTGLSACAVRFGNVLGSRGSVIPLFEKQIEAGGPVTITDKRMVRYFMTIPEAAGLIIEAGAFGDSGVVYMLDMGEPVRIVDVAKRLIQLHGKRLGADIEIQYTGLRPGEKLFEELSLDFEMARPTDHPKVRILEETAVNHREPIPVMVKRLLGMIESDKPGQIRKAIMRTVEIADGIELTLAESQTRSDATETA